LRFGGAHCEALAVEELRDEDKEKAKKGKGGMHL